MRARLREVPARPGEGRGVALPGGWGHHGRDVSAYSASMARWNGYEDSAPDDSTTRRRRWPVATTPRNPPLRTARPSATSTSDGSARVAPGPKPSVGATIYSVADRAGVSIATVSRVLQGSTVVSEAARQKVLDAVDALHYVPAGRRAQPGRATPRGLRAGAPRAHRSLLLRAADGLRDARGRARPERRAAARQRQERPPTRRRSPGHPGRRHRRARLGRDAASRRAGAARSQAGRHHRRRPGRRSGLARRCGARRRGERPQCRAADGAPLRPRPHPAALRR